MSRSHSFALSFRRFAVGSVLAAACVAPASAAATPLVPVPSVDLQRYIGDWKQVAAIPQWFEALCQKDVTANYRQLADGTVGVTNVCKGPFNSSIVARGKARVLDKTSNARLQVSFVNVFGTWFYPNAQPNYNIIGLGEAYDWAVVGGSDQSSAFVLSRTARLSAEQRAAVLSTLEANGYNACRLKVTRQTGGATAVRPFCQEA